MTDEARFRDILRAALARVRTQAKTDPLFVPNEEATVFATAAGPMPELIMVADNPGPKERSRKEYLSGLGSAGRWARAFLDAAFDQPGAVGSKVLVWNKSTYHTPRTGGLSALMRSKDQALVARLQGDQAENGRLLARLAALSRVPVLAIGLERDKTTFAAFRSSLEAEAKSLGEWRAVFRGMETSAFLKAPHFSICNFFRHNADEAWNTRFDAYLVEWAAKHPEIRTKKGNVSPKALIALPGPAPQEAYLRQVILCDV
ncbi:MAG TPA: hypothetical protein VFZ09_45415 [Archangium sp.]|uniref:hypothetical protein n=1 Tax=Archangium sp. TaxID=1872627 RepID=UPI002E30DC6A|nr:hypothetical protein [Archangium sp.]HEX5753522.1 hypothetical protein [Archangium sp.]